MQRGTLIVVDVSPPPPTPTPYRAGKPLTEIIPPDRRRLKAAVLVVTSMVAGAALWAVGGVVVDIIKSERVAPTVPAPPSGYVAGRIGSAVLRGPDKTVTLPPKTRSVVNVWLQGCADCMPAFDAMKALMQEGGLGTDAVIINVAYGEADLTWAQRYGVADNLVFDPAGANVVRPLGIGTFTTLVVEPDGSIIHRDRPDRPGFAARVRAALGATRLRRTYPAPDPADPYASPGNPHAEPLGPEDVQRVVASHTAAIRRTCWERRGDGSRSSANITVGLTIEADGTVSTTSAAGDDPVVARCIESQTRTWRFPARETGGVVTTVSIPFKFVRE
jgi:hypothetical protein